MVQKGFNAILFPNQFLVTTILALEKPKSHGVTAGQLSKNSDFVPIFFPVQLVNTLQISLSQCRGRFWRDLLFLPVFVIKKVMTDDQ